MPLYPVIECLYLETESPSFYHSFCWSGSELLCCYYQSTTKKKLFWFPIINCVWWPVKHSFHWRAYHWVDTLPTADYKRAHVIGTVNPFLFVPGTLMRWTQGNYCPQLSVTQLMNQEMSLREKERMWKRKSFVTAQQDLEGTNRDSTKTINLATLD